jgi:hypothetical protein
VTHKNFSKIAVLKALKNSILEAIPEKLKDNKDHNILSI